MERVGKGAERFGVVIYAYFIMGNHYHLLLETPYANLSSFMHFVGTAFANRLSRRGWIGHVFSGRYKAVCAERGESLVPLSRYIHRNPLEAGIVHELEDYPWSSYRCYLGLDEAPAWLDLGPALRQLSLDLPTARELYRKVVLSDWQGLPDCPPAEVWAGSVMGSQQFFSRVIAKAGRKGGLDQVSGKALLIRPLDLERLFRCVCAYRGLDITGETDKTGGKRGRRPRCMFIYLAKKHTAALNKEIGDMVEGLSPSGVTRQYTRTIELISRDEDEACRWAQEEEAILSILSIVKP